MSALQADSVEPQSGPDASGLAAPLSHSERNLALEAVRVTEAAALAAARLVGRGDEKAADAAAVDAMRRALNGLSIDGRVVIGEGERDEAPMLYVGEKVGRGGPKADIALDPLEGTTITATGGANAMSVIAMAEEGGFLHSPDVYMNKIAVGGGLPQGIVDLDNPVDHNLIALAQAKGKSVDELLVCILDGDVAGVIATSRIDTGVDIYMGSGGAPEGVLAAAALRCIGGQMQGRLIFRNDEEKARAERCGITDLGRKYELLDLAKGNVMFAATGVTDGPMLRGVRVYAEGAKTHSLVMRSKTGTVREIQATHVFARKAPLDPTFSRV